MSMRELELVRENQRLKARICELETELRTDDVFFLDLAPTARKILSILYRRHDHGPIQRDKLYDLLWGHCHHAREPKNLDVQMLHLRRRVADRGITIVTVRGFGFGLTPDSIMLLDTKIHIAVSGIIFATRRAKDALVNIKGTR